MTKQRGSSEALCLFGSKTALFFCLAVSTIALARSVVHPGPPPILGGIRCDSWQQWSDCEEPNRQFTALLQRRFPIGTTELLVKETLQREEFGQYEKSPATCLQPGQVPRVGELSIGCPPWDPNWNPSNHLEYWWTRNAACS